VYLEVSDLDASVAAFFVDIDDSLIVTRDSRVTVELGPLTSGQMKLASSRKCADDCPIVWCPRPVHDEPLQTAIGGRTGGPSLEVDVISAGEVVLIDRPNGSPRGIKGAIAVRR
jgi:hypothetical protein